MKKLFNISVVTAVFLFVSACQSTNSLQLDNDNNAKSGVFLDNKFYGYKNVKVESEANIFALSAEMKVMAKRIAAERNTHTKATKLLKHFFSPEDINLAYKSGANLIAAKAYQNKEANCLSLTIMAYAIAQEANLNVAFQSVDVPEYWVRNGSVNMLTGHINLAVLEQKVPQKVLFWQRNDMEIDFDPFVLKKSFPKHRINKNTVLAMFYNNKGANAMVDGDYVVAYAYLKAATEIAPTFSPAWGNLGILYRFKGYEKSAIETYQYAINLDRNNLTAMSNLSMLLHINGKYEEAKRLDTYIMRKRANNPYYYALLGDERFYQGAYNQAINHYKKAIKLNDSIHELYFGLAKVYYMLDEVGKAKNYMKKAMAKDHGQQQGKQYLAKLNFLKQVDRQQ